MGSTNIASQVNVGDIPSGNYTRLNEDGTIDTKGTTSDSIQFDTESSPKPNAEGLMQWNPTDGTVDLGMSGGDVTLQIGQEMFIKVSNISGATIPNGSAVYISGRQGNRPTIELALGSSPSTSSVVGLATQDIENNSIGFITTVGYVRQIKTNYDTWAEGDHLWLSTTVPGAITNVEPSIPHYSPIVGCVGIVHSNLGSILVRIINNRNLQGLSDVNGSPLYVSGQPLFWDEQLQVFDFFNVWDDLRIPVTASKLGSQDKPDFDYTNIGLLFPQNSTSEFICTIVQMPHAYKVGTSIYPHIHFVQTSSSVPVFKMTYRWYDGGGDPSVSFTTITTNSLRFTYTSGSLSQVASFPPIVCPITNISSILDVKIYRDDNVVTGDVLVKEFDIHYQLDTLGSKTVSVK